MSIALIDIDFLLNSAQNCKKIPFFGQFKEVKEGNMQNQEGNMETRQIIPFFPSTFSTLFVTFIFVFENSQNSFSCGPLFCPF